VLSITYCVPMRSLYLTSSQVGCVWAIPSSVTPSGQYKNRGNINIVARKLFEKCVQVRIFTNKPVVESVLWLFTWFPPGTVQNYWLVFQLHKLWEQLFTRLLIQRTIIGACVSGDTAWNSNQGAEVAQHQRSSP